jgi:hypothetical protein
MKVITGIVLSMLAYLAISIVLVLVVHACLPGEITWDGQVVGQLALLLDLGVQGIACFAAGAVALSHAQGSVRLATAAMGGAIFTIVLGSTLSFWNLAPPWYDWAVIAMTLPFVALGAAWRRAAWPGVPARAPARARAR